MGRLNKEFDTSGIAKRVQLVMAEKGVNQTSLASLIGIEQNSLSVQLKGKKMSLVTVYGTLENFPDISPDWLLFGHGEMKRTVGTSINIQRQGNVNSVGSVVTQTMERRAPTPSCQNCHLVNKLTELLQLALSNR